MKNIVKRSTIVIALGCLIVAINITASPYSAYASSPDQCADACKTNHLEWTGQAGPLMSGAISGHGCYCKKP